MCGLIAGLHFGGRKDEPVNEFIINQFEDQADRGTKGFGMVPIILGAPIKVARATSQTKALIDLYMNQAPMIMFHHRMPTSSDNKIGQTHPIEVSHKDFKSNYLVIHNGVISNASELKAEHAKLDLLYTTSHPSQYQPDVYKFNDSEALAVELALYLEGKKSIIGTRGSAAFIALECDKMWKPIKMHFGRNDSNPLKLASSRDFIYLSSEGKGDEVKSFMLYSMNLNGIEIKMTKKPFQMAPALAVTPSTSVRSEYGYDRDAYGYGYGRHGGHMGYRGSSEICKEPLCHEDVIRGKDQCSRHFIIGSRTPDNVPARTTTPDISMIGAGPRSDIEVKERTPAQASLEDEELAIEIEQMEENAETTRDDAYSKTDDLMNELLDQMKDDKLPDVDAYMHLIKAFVERAYRYNKEYLLAITPTTTEKDYKVGMGKEGLECENFLISAEIEEMQEPTSGDMAEIEAEIKADAEEARRDLTLID